MRTAESMRLPADGLSAMLVGFCGLSVATMVLMKELCSFVSNS